MLSVNVQIYNIDHTTSETFLQNNILKYFVCLDYYISQTDISSYILVYCKNPIPRCTYTLLRL